ncbi:esterase/lipase family protein [Fuerstiella marisgermanici]|uniref:AB hydrolase-1 domain-containing protein n=1 Tax=Fuerstiella marisgermanici TaxID=1891926 RepID=A0A1P8WGF4_9PLAN|nr:alpha/beta fold hydrolase [Fuerstiella marisgermanici]APZ93120.1 putative protein with an alpha/beta hydrolase fold protein [Fuerstiella marisgermanici]
MSKRFEVPVDITTAGGRLSSATANTWRLGAFACVVFLSCSEIPVMSDEQKPAVPPSDVVQPTAEPQSSGSTYPGGIFTMGGRQLWGDVAFFRGWRIQHNVLTGRYRLLDAADFRHESGSLAECEHKLKTIRNELNLPDMDGNAVLLIHGIGRSSKCFSGMAKSLRNDGYVVVPFEYPSTRVSIPTSADYLRSVVQSLEGIDRIDVVCHSMGGLLLRTYLSQHKAPRFRRAVLLGVPNNGAEMADMLKNNPLFKAVLGPAGQQLVTDDEGLIRQLPSPDFEFGVVAGGRNGPKGYNPLLPGDNDSTVTVASTRLSGATDFLLLPVIHSFLMTDARSIAATRHFLKHGTFVADRPAQPITGEGVEVVE